MHGGGLLRGCAGDDDVRAEARQLIADRRSDPAGPAGDQRQAPGKDVVAECRLAHWSTFALRAPVFATSLHASRHRSHHLVGRHPRSRTRASRLGFAPLAWTSSWRPVSLMMWLQE